MMSEILFYCGLLIMVGIGFFSQDKVAAGITCVAGGSFVVGCALIAMALNREE